jgi:hypothetical protein
MREKADVLDDVSDHAAQAYDIPFRDAAAVNVDLALGLHQQAVDKFEGSGLAGATAAQKHQSLAALDFEIQVAQEFVASVESVGDVAEMDGGAVVGRIGHIELRNF